MPYEAPGARHTVTATKACKHGQIVVEHGFVGTAFKIDQVDRWVKPINAQDIAIGEEFEIQVGGIHEAPLVAPYAAAVVGTKIFINPATNGLDDASAAGFLPVGVVDEIDVIRTPDVVRINSNAWQAFLPGA